MYAYASTHARSIYIADKVQVSETDPSIMTIDFSYCCDNTVEDTAQAALVQSNTWTIFIQGTVQDLSGNSSEAGSVKVNK